jgi:SPX domain protein involved in polyphosphate accumulation
MYDWFDKGWIHLVAISPEDNNLYLLYKDEFKIYTPLKKVLKTENINEVIENGEEMATNHILDATLENIPTYVYSN